MSDMGFEPHTPVDGEKTFTRFVRHFGGEVISDRLPTSPPFDNADFYFSASDAIAELKCFQTDFPRLQLYKDKAFQLHKKWISERKMSFAMIFGNEPMPVELRYEYVRLFRDPIQGILRKANRQIKATKLNLGLNTSKGILVLLNDGLYGLPPAITVSLTSSILTHQFSAIDCFVS